MSTLSDTTSVTETALPKPSNAITEKIPVYVANKPGRPYFTVTPYKNIPLSDVPAKVIRYWEQWEDDDVPDRYVTTVRYELRKWGFLEPVVKRTEEEKIEAQRQKSLLYMRERRNREKMILAKYSNTNKKQN
jgi:preprotein translocase subunit SecD